MKDKTKGYIIIVSSMVLQIVLFIGSLVHKFTVERKKYYGHTANTLDVQNGMADYIGQEIQYRSDYEYKLSAIVDVKWLAVITTIAMIMIITAYIML